MTPGPWYYVTGAVWTTPLGPDDGGACIATRASASPILPTDKDENLRAIAQLPNLIHALELIRDSNDFRDGTFVSELQGIARSALAKV